MYLRYLNIRIVSDYLALLKFSLSLGNLKEHEPKLWTISDPKSYSINYQFLAHLNQGEVPTNFRN